MVLERQTSADTVRYRWTQLDGTPITAWFDELTQALDYAIESATR